MRERLQKTLARAGVGSRRACEKLIAEGRVCLNGAVVTELGVLADPARDRITVDGERIKSERKVYIALNKPGGYISTNADPRGRRIVRELLPRLKERVYTVGRLDRDAEGLLLLTNDGAFAHRVAHPRSKVPKTYLVDVKGRLTPAMKERLEKGIRLDGRKTLPASIRLARGAGGLQRLRVTITEGRKRQIKRMFRAAGCPVVRLKRISIGGLKLGRLPVGHYRFLDENELGKIWSHGKRR